jgi:hypothetical protein
MKQKTSSITVKKAYFENGFNHSMEDIIREINIKLPDKQERTYDEDLFIKYEIGQIEILSDMEGAFVRIHSSESDTIALVDQEERSAKNILEEHSPPEKKRFLKCEIFLYINSNHILACNLNNRDTLFKNIIHNVAEKAKIVDSHFKFIISNIPNKTELARIQQVGVKKIDFGISGYLANMDEKVGFFDGKFNKLLSHLFETPDANGPKKRTNTLARLTLTRGKFKKDEIEKDEWVTEIGEIVAESDIDDYTITLEDGTKISTKNLTTSKKCNITKHANTLDYDSVKEELTAYYKELKKTGQLDW